MKKIVSFMLVAVLLLSLCACAPSENTIKNALVGKWGTQTQDGEKISGLGWKFNADGTACSFIESIEMDGTYVIEDDKIILTYENGTTSVFVYSYSNGELKLKAESAAWWNLWKQ